MGVAAYQGPFRREHAERLLWRAGFGPRKGEAEALAKLGLEGAVRSLTRPKGEKFVGKPPHDDKGRALAPADAWGHDHLWWLDRMVRTSRPLVERMTLVWHDWFATSLEGVGSQKLMLNENYARELMELFTLGAGNGYSERDVREQARALTGFDNDWKRGAGNVNFRYDRERHDAGTKRIFDKRGAFDWEDAVRLCLAHPKHGSFFVEKLWHYFIPTAPDAATRRSLEAMYRKDHEIRPVVEAILRHPALHRGPRMVKPPAVYTAGLLRAIGRGIDTNSWAWLASGTGQRLFMPPNVAGWDDG